MSELNADIPSDESPVVALSTPNWLDQDDVLRELWLRKEQPAQIAEKLGRTVAAVMTRAARLGLPRRAAPGRKPGYQRKPSVGTARGEMPKKAHAVTRRADDEVAPVEEMKMMRICLMCLNRFLSEGRHNRICPDCKGSAQYLRGNSVPDTFKVDA